MELQILDPEESTPLTDDTCHSSANFETFTRWFPSWKASHRWKAKQEGAFAAENRKVLHTTEFGRLKRPRRGVITKYVRLVRIGWERSNSRTTGKPGIRVQFQPVVIRGLEDAMVGPSSIAIRRVVEIYGRNPRLQNAFWQGRPNLQGRS